ncbi:MAG: YggS family pyridoxal phosphate-dependent enzyme [Bdellovibrionales bacterium]|nr:YggS family pyridoxal phosphate-dependent enzyme [Bdellovibrionales bacterium]
MDENIEDNFKSIVSKIKSTCERINRDPNEISLLAVSKKQSADKIKNYISLTKSLGLKPALGENYVQEYKLKREHLADDHECHLIGHLQSNKAKLAVELFTYIETIDSEKLVASLEKELEKQGKQLPCLVQVNVSDDINKEGIEISAVEDFILNNFDINSRLLFSGLMTITKFYDEPEDARADFRAMSDLKKLCLKNSKICEVLSSRKFELSMGMSADFCIAIEEGATIIRVGSSIFGSRN